MEHPEIAFGEDGEFVSVWVGQFASEEAVDAYTAEQYDEDRDDEPISPFAADIGLKFYDHDFMEVHFELGLSGKAAGAFAQHSYGDYSEAWAAAQRVSATEFDTVLLLYGYDHKRYPQRARQPQKVRFIGTYTCHLDSSK